MNKKIHIAVLCGGQSAEHEVSIQSAKNVVQALDPARYEILVIHITHQGEWRLLESPEIILKNADMQPLPDHVKGQRLGLNFGHDKPFIRLDENTNREIAIDVVFPILHGVHGEDGTLQGMLELINIPYVGAGTLGSAVSMDKEVTKQLLRFAGIAVSDWIVLEREEQPKINFAEAVEKLGLPIFVKPSNTGSSVGVVKVKNAEDFNQALDTAWQYDHKIILEQFIPGREIECAVLGNGNPEASLLGEIIPTGDHEFYSYEAKYLDPNGAILKVPVELPIAIQEKIQTIAKKAFKVLGCTGMARVDFFLTPDNQIYVNEANTIPGFTQISMYPKLWQVSGLSYSALIDRLVELAFHHFEQDRVLVNQFNVAERKGH